MQLVPVAAVPARSHVRPPCPEQVDRFQRPAPEAREAVAADAHAAAAAAVGPQAPGGAREAGPVCQLARERVRWRVSTRSFVFGDFVFSFYAGELLLASLNSLLLLPCLPLFSASKHLKMLLDSPVMSNISGAVTAGVRSVGGSGVAGGGNADEAGFGGGGGPAGLITSSR